MIQDDLAHAPACYPCHLLACTMDSAHATKHSWHACHVMSMHSHAGQGHHCSADMCWHAPAAGIQHGPGPSTGQLAGPAKRRADWQPGTLMSQHHYVGAHVCGASDQAAVQRAHAAAVLVSAARQRAPLWLERSSSAVVCVHGRAGMCAQLPRGHADGLTGCLQVLMVSCPRASEPAGPLGGSSRAVGNSASWSSTRTVTMIW
jgi:hypothetical protein